MTNVGHSPDKPWINNPLRRLRDGGTFNEVKVLLRESHNYVTDTTYQLAVTRDRRNAFGARDVLFKFSWILSSCTLFGKTTTPR